jgi:hypothetical protein
MNKLEIVQHAIRELGDVSLEELSSFIHTTHGLKIEPKFLPIFKASLWDKARAEASRHAARMAAQQAAAEQAAVPQTTAEPPAL